MDSELFFTRHTSNDGFTAVPARRLRIRRHAPGASFLEFEGKNQRVSRDGLSNEGIEFSFTQRLRYAINFKLATLRFDPVALFSSLGRVGTTLPRAIGKSLKGSGEGIRRAVYFVPKLIAVAVVTLLCAAGVSRFVHVDVRAIAHSVHFALPHFLTPWRPVEDESTEPAQATVAHHEAAPVQYSPAAGPAAAASGTAGSPEAQTQSPSQTPAYVPPYYRRGPGSYLPMPADGPLPAGMASTYVPSTTAPVTLTVHAPFSEPDADPQQDDDVVLMSKPEVKEVVVQPERKEKPTPEKKPEARAATDNRQANRVAHPTEHPAPTAQTSQPAQPAQQAQQPNTRVSGDLVLLQQSAPADTQQQGAGQDDDPDAPVPLTVNQPRRPAAEAPAVSSGPARPSFSVVTHTDDSIVVRVDGQMKQISIGQPLPDGSKLLSVNHDGGGFTTSRGKFAAY
ncbi:hypothetical protein [Paraburkholderia sp. SIMBA_054]|uniref:hypothetical protein n=1 Tax=Paraburkholderia sp. SIMBA_054 TaxID=3085795 RepID=UPI00397E71DA